MTTGLAQKLERHVCLPVSTSSHMAFLCTMTFSLTLEVIGDLQTVYGSPGQDEGDFGTVM